MRKAAYLVVDLVIGLLLAWVFLQIAVSRPAHGDFKSLTRDEPVVHMVLQEAANEPFAGMVAIAGVAYDRVFDRRWPSDLRNVIYEPAQFTGLGIALRRYSQAQITRARLAVTQAYLGARPCGTVLWYHTVEVSPSWNRMLYLKCQLGVHMFFGEVE